jgi:sugar lactone lactonase YvrE
MKNRKNSTAFYTILLLGLLQSCMLRPLAWEPPKKIALYEEFTINHKLESIEKIELGGWCGPEDIIMDSLGYIYCGVHKSKNDFSDGKIIKIAPDKTITTLYDAQSWVAGLHFDNKGNLLALSHKEGLISIDKNQKITVLASKDEQGRPFLIPNGLDIASNGLVYFSNTSHESAYTIKYGRQLILEIKPTGGLYEYNPKTQKVRTLIDGTYFGNGVILSQKEDFILLTETTKYRVLKYWLAGPSKGKTEIFIDNLPGFPNGISIRPDGSYWLGFTTIRNDALDKIHPKKGMKKFVYALPNFLQPKAVKFGLILNLSPQGKILDALLDPTGNWVSEAGSVKEYNGNLYIGGDIIPYISKYKLAPDI